MGRAQSASMLAVTLEVHQLSLNSVFASLLEAGQGRAGGCQGALAAEHQEAPGRASSSAKPAPGPGQAGWLGAGQEVGDLGGTPSEKQPSL